jgi:hypothetical protein
VPKPGNHNIVYSNCKGRFFVFDKRIGTEKGYYVGATNIYGHNPSDLKYRFQRVSPIHVSPHNPDVVYHGSQYVHRTTDEGQTWETISPDLTAFEDDQQVISGSPITRDITGEEYYSTIYSLRESPVQPGVIWSGSNDGPVYVTQDNGDSWQNITPRGLPPGGRVDSVEPSPHDAAKAYIAVLRYQLGDWKPYIYKTEDFGRRWELLTDGSNGIPMDFPTRVVREDPVRAGLLFAGTEFGMFVSLDDGANWHEFQQNLGVTPITDLKIIRGDLAISTMGRSFWVLDNISTLRQDDFQMTGDDALLFEPKDTIRYRNVYRGQAKRAVPDYPPPAAIIDYYLPEEFDGSVKLEILDASGALVKAYESIGNGDGADDVIEDMDTSSVVVIADQSLSMEPGMNRFRWDMTHFGAWSESTESRYSRGPLARPGIYTVRLTAGDSVVAQEFELKVDPRVLEQGTSMNDIDEQVAFQLVLVDLLSEVRKFQKQLVEEHEKLEAGSDELTPDQASRLLVVTDVLNQVKSADIIYPQPMLTNQVSYLYNMVNTADQAPGIEAADRYAELAAKLAELKSTYSGD